MSKQMEDVVVFPVRRTWHTVRSLEKFLVDVVRDNGVVRRGYVCDIKENGLLVKVGWRTLLVPFHRLRLPNDDLGDKSNTTHSEIEVLMGINTDYESWERATLISSWEFTGSYEYGSGGRTYTLLYVNLEDYKPPAQGIIIDGDNRITQRALMPGQASAEITANTFCKLIVPMPSPTQDCPDPASILRRACALFVFQEQWLYSTDTLFVALNDDHVEILRPSDSKPSCREGFSEKDHYRNLLTEVTTKWPLPAFLERFDKRCSAVVLDVMSGMVLAVHLKDESNANDPRFQDLPVLIHLQLLSCLDVYAQNRLIFAVALLMKRLSKFVQLLLDTLPLERSAIIPAYNHGSVKCSNFAEYDLLGRE